MIETAVASDRLPAELVVTTRFSRDGAEHVESRHYGHLVVARSDGTVVGALGDPHHATFARSTAKPFQTAASLALAGDPDLPAPLIAVGWSSHRGERAHLDAVRRLLARAELRPDDLTNPSAAPLADPGRSPTRLAHNCSGKHALFALAGRAVGCPRSALLDPAGPLQRAVLAAVAEAIGPVLAVGIDGCGAPAVVTPLVALARGYANLLDPKCRWARVVEAGFAHPRLVGGAGRLESSLLAAGVVAKPGAEGVFAAAWRTAEGGVCGAALKIADGASRASSVALHALLTAAGVVSAEVWSPPPVLGGGRPAGRILASHAVTGLGARLVDG